MQFLMFLRNFASLCYTNVVQIAFLNFRFILSNFNERERGERERETDRDRDRDRDRECVCVVVM